MKKTVFTVILLAIAAIAQGSTTWTLNGKTYQVDTLYHASIGPGTTQTSLKLAGPVKFRIFYTTTDLTDPYVDVRAIKHTDKLHGTGTVSEAMKSHSSADRTYFSGVNADFFSGTSPCGITVVDGEVYGSAQSAGWSLFGINENRLPMAGSGELAVVVTMPSGEKWNCMNVNRKRGSDELALYTTRQGETTAAGSDGTEVAVVPTDNSNRLTPGAAVKMKVTGSPVSGVGSMTIPTGGYVLSGNGKAAEFVGKLKDGDEVTVRCAVRFNGITGGRVVQALGGCPMILSEGKVLDTAGALDHLSTAQPRTAVGYNAERNKVVMLVADGRSSISAGPISKVLAGMMKEAGCSEAMNFDGGGSSELYVKELGIRNVPSDGQERKVTNGLYLSTDSPADSQIARIGFEDYAKVMSAGEVYSPTFYGYNRYGVLVDSDLKGVSLATPDGKTFCPDAPGCYPLAASYNGLTATIAVTVTGDGSVGDVQEDKMRYGPNPVRQGQPLRIAAGERAVAVRVYDLNGRLLMSLPVAGLPEIQIPTSDLPAGTYLLEIIGEEKKSTVKFAVES